MACNDLLDRIGELSVLESGVDDQQVCRFGPQKGVQLRRIGRCLEGVCVPQDMPEMCQQVARKEGDDVHGTVSDVLGTKTRVSGTKCGFTRIAATLAL